MTKPKKKKLTKKQQAAKLERARELKRERDRRYREKHREQKRERDREYQHKRRERIRKEKSKPKPKPKRHGENRGERTKQNGGTVEVRWRHRILIGGPADREEDARAELRELLLESLERCPVFTASGLSERYAEQIAEEAQYVAVEHADPIVRVDSVDVLYRNPPNGWKWWSRIRRGEDTIDPGEWS